MKNKVPKINSKELLIENNTNTPKQYKYTLKSNIIDYDNIF